MAEWRLDWSGEKMSLSSNFYDIAFIGHVCFDEVIPYQGTPRVAPGSAVLCGALAAARVGKKVAVVTKMAPQDDGMLESLRQNGVDFHVIPAAETTYMKVLHPSESVDERQIFQLKNAGFFSLTEMPVLAAHRLHLAGITDQEFSIGFISSLKKMYHLSADMQSFVRQVQPPDGNIEFRDVPNKQEIVGLLDMIKLDIVEAKVLTSTDDLAEAAKRITDWGCPEVVITQAEGVLAQVNGQTYYEKFTNRSVAGRTGRGDTAFGAYLARRMDHDVAESLKFAAALVSIKMETPGPFNGTLAEVLARMQ
jgi:sugar/nucleoside kinase (ribokinase family)